MNRIKLPAETSYAMLTMPRADVYKPLIEYIIKNKSAYDLGFEFIYSRTINPVFLIGREDEEKIPLVRFPVTVETNNVTYVVSNLSGSLKSELINNNLVDSKRSDYVDFETTRNLLVYYTLSKQDIDMLATYTAQLATAWISKTVKNYLRLDPNTEADVEAALFIYFIRQYIYNVSNDDIKIKMNNLLSAKWRNSNELIYEILTRLDGKDLDMGTYIKTVANDHPALVKLDTSTINSFVSNNWYSGSDNSNIQIYIATEDLHTMASMLYHASETPTGRKTMLGRMLNDYKRTTRITDLVYLLKQMIKSKRN